MQPQARNGLLAATRQALPADASTRRSVLDRETVFSPADLGAEDVAPFDLIVEAGGTAGSNAARQVRPTEASSAARRWPGARTMRGFQLDTFKAWPFVRHGRRACTSLPDLLPVDGRDSGQA